MSTKNDDPHRTRDPYHLVGTLLKSRYMLNEFVEEGGMSIVYRANDLDNGSLVAVKILAPRFLSRQSQAETYLNLFKREAEVTQRLIHPNIVTIYDSAIENGLAFIVMEWLEGRTLGQELLNGRLPLGRASVILQQVCTALETAHRQKIIHLDLKPNNIFLTSQGMSDDFVKVIDFGLSRIIQSTMGTTISRVVGTPHYIAPEVFAGKASRLSDIYSLGIVTYEMMTGLMPFGSSHIYALIHEHIEKPPPSARAANPEIPELIDELIKRAMSKNPAYRPKSATDFYGEFARANRSNVDQDTKHANVRTKVYASNRRRTLFPNTLRLDMLSFWALMATIPLIFSLHILIFSSIFSIKVSPIYGLLIYLTTTFLFSFALHSNDELKNEPILRIFARLFMWAMSPIIWLILIPQTTINVTRFISKLVQMTLHKRPSKNRTG